MKYLDPEVNQNIEHSVRIYYIKGTVSQFDDVVDWLNENVGSFKKEWYFDGFGPYWYTELNPNPWIQYNFLRKNDAIAFKLRYDVNGISHIGKHWYDET